jgi:antitoxin component YwqK of YwqJK toxin-antitoxin module
MKHLLLIGTFTVLLFFSCSQESNWKNTHYYPSGKVSAAKEYQIVDEDTVFIYERIFYENGKVKIEGPLKNEKRNGQWKSYFVDGKDWSQTSFKDGEMEGETVSYYKNGKIRYSGMYEMGKVAGKWAWFDSTGTLIRSADFDVEKYE